MVVTQAGGTTAYSAALDIEMAALPFGWRPDAPLTVVFKASRPLHVSRTRKLGTSEWGSGALPPLVESLIATETTRTLVVDAAPDGSRDGELAGLAVAALLARHGWDTSWSAQLLPEDHLQVPAGVEPEVVLAVVGPPSRDFRPTRALASFDHAAAFARAWRQARIPVVALGVGASALALAAFADGGVHCAIDLGELAPALRAALRGGDPTGGRPRRNLGDASARQMPGAAPGRPGAQPSHNLELLMSLTNTERKVLYSLTQGLAAAEIAEDLVVSMSTVRAHIRSILRKLDVTSQVAAVAIANGAEPGLGRSRTCLDEREAAAGRGRAGPARIRTISLPSD